MNLEREVVLKLTNKGETVSSMESCTGGHFADTITNVDGSSSVIKFSAVTYSNEYKIVMGVDKEIIDKYSVYSFETSRSMAKEISNFAKSTYGVGITGKLNRVDENNLVGENNIIFVTIYNSKNDECTDIKVECPNEIRSKCKDYIVNIALKKLLEIIGD